MRVFFAGRYWAREAIQTQAEFRFSINKDTFMISLFSDLSVMRDRSQRRPTFGIGEGFGPGVHALLFDLIAIDFYYGFGFDRYGFDHNYYLSISTVY